MQVQCLSRTVPFKVSHAPKNGQPAPGPPPGRWCRIPPNEGRRRHLEKGAGCLVQQRPQPQGLEKSTSPQIPRDSGNGTDSAPREMAVIPPARHAAGLARLTGTLLPFPAQRDTDGHNEGSNTWPS